MLRKLGGVSPLHRAVDGGNKDIVELLLQTPGCQVDRVSSWNNDTPLLRAIYTGFYYHCTIKTSSVAS